MNSKSFRLWRYCLVAVLAQAATTFAQTADFGVQLQPFNRATNSGSSREVRRAELVERPITVAYYRNDAAPMAQPVVSSDGPPLDGVPRVVASSSGPTVAGNYAVLRNGVAYAPSRAPANVKNAIWAVNTLRRKPYVWGGGHRSFSDFGYDCSGTVSYALHYAGLLDTPMPSSDFVRYGERGRGRWITIYARRGHTFAVIAGLRLDTTNMRNGGDVGPRWYTDGRDVHNFDVRHPRGW